MRKTQLLLTWDCEAGYGPEHSASAAGVQVHVTSQVHKWLHCAVSAGVASWGKAGLPGQAS